MTEEHVPYQVTPEPTQESAHEHLYRVAVSNKNIVRFCERCGQTWLITQLQDMLHPSRSVYCWTEVLEEDEAREKLTGTE
ncbi:MAG: hypothetical protein ACJ8DI_25630 [Ktedonobacteraceae bacterium]